MASKKQKWFHADQSVLGLGQSTLELAANMILARNDAVHVVYSYHVKEIDALVVIQN